MTCSKQTKRIADTEYPCPRWGHAMCAFEDEIIMFGGYQSSKYYNDLWKFNLNTFKFTQADQHGQVPPPCSNFTMNLDEKRGKILLFGGGTLNKEKLNTIYELDIKTSEWKKLPCKEYQSMPQQRSYHCSEVMGNYLVVFGGEFFQDLDDLWLYNLITLEWTEVKLNERSVKPQARKFASSFQYQNRMYIVAGCHGKYECLDDAYYMDFSTFFATNNIEDLQWKQVQLENNEMVRRWGHVAAVKDNKAIIFGGRYNNKDLQNIVEIDLIEDKCQQMHIKGASPKGRRKPGFCLKNNSLFCFSGFDGSYIKDFIQLSLVERPKLSIENKVEDAKFQSLLGEFTYCKTEEFDTYFQAQVLHLKNAEYEKCVDHIISNVSVPIKVKNFPIAACGYEFAKRSKYFQILMQAPVSSKEIELFKPQGITQEDYIRVVYLFVLYMEFGKVVFSEESIKDKDRYVGYLLQMAEYYCIDKLFNLTITAEIRQIQMP